MFSGIIGERRIKLSTYLIGRKLQYNGKGPSDLAENTATFLPATVLVILSHAT